MKSLKQAIRDNQRFHKYRHLLSKIRLRIFDYEDAGKLEKAHRVIEKIETICKPFWSKQT